MCRFALLVLLLLSVLLGSALGSGRTMTYTVYSDSLCQNAISNGTWPTTYDSYAGTSGYWMDCNPATGVPGATYTTGGCFTNSAGVYIGSLGFFANGLCSNPSVASYGDTPPGTCGLQALPQTGPGSIIITCSNDNGAHGLVAMSLPILAALSIIALLLI